MGQTGHDHSFGMRLWSFIGSPLWKRVIHGESWEEQKAPRVEASFSVSYISLLKYSYNNNDPYNF